MVTGRCPVATGKRLSPCAAATTASGPDSSESIQNVQRADALVDGSKVVGVGSPGVIAVCIFVLRVATLSCL